MRIAYCTNVRLPSERAHGHQIAQVCDALIHLGHAVTIVAPYRRNSVTDAFHRYYGTDPAITLLQCNRFDPIGHPLFPGVLGLWVLNVLLRSSLKTMFSRTTFDVLYARSPALLSPLLHTHLPVVLELHQLPRRGTRIFVRSCNACRLVVCLTSPMRDALIKNGANPKRVIVEGDAVDLKRFSALPSPASAKTLFHLPTDRPVIGYIGSLVTRDTLEKGVRELLQALMILQDRGIPFCGFIVGGPMHWRKRYEEVARSLHLTSENIRFHDHLATALVPHAMQSCDVCVYPAPASQDPYFLRDTSPLKLFEYMAAGKPIVSADLPPVRDILDATTALLVPPGDAQALADALQATLADPHSAQKRAITAHKRVQDHTWDKRMERIIERLS